MSDVTSRAWWRWEYMVGAIVTDYGAGVRICGVTKDYLHGAAVETPTNNHGPVWMRLRKERCTAVDETDPATLGCLTQRARDLWQSPGLNTSPYTDVITDADGWCVRVPGRGFFTGPTEFAALLAACDAAPGGAP